MIHFEHLAVAPAKPCNDEQAQEARSYSAGTETEIENDGGMLRPIDGYEPGTEPPAEGPATPTGTAA